MLKLTLRVNADWRERQANNAFGLSLSHRSIAYNKQPWNLRRNGTDEQAAESVTDSLGHVAFMAWLIECRDQRDARIMRELTLHKELFGNQSAHLAADVTWALVQP